MMSFKKCSSSKRDNLLTETAEWYLQATLSTYLILYTPLHKIIVKVRTIKPLISEKSTKATSKLHSKQDRFIMSFNKCSFFTKT